MNTFLTMQQSTPKTCVLNLVPPVFSGIQTLVAQSNGALLAGWNPAVDADGDLPIEYEVYVKKGTATGLFSVDPLLTYETQIRIMTLADGSLLENALYFVGVRAKDSEQNIETNIISLSAVSVGVLDAGLVEAVQAMRAVAQAITGDLVGISEEKELIGTTDNNDELVGQLQCEV